MCKICAIQGAYCPWGLTSRHSHTTFPPDGCVTFVGRDSTADLHKAARFWKLDTSDWSAEVCPSSESCRLPLSSKCSRIFFFFAMLSPLVNITRQFQILENPTIVDSKFTSLVPGFAPALPTLPPPQGGCPVARPGAAVATAPMRRVSHDDAWPVASDPWPLAFGPQHPAPRTSSRYQGHGPPRSQFFDEGCVVHPEVSAGSL